MTCCGGLHAPMADCSCPLEAAQRTDGEYRDMVLTERLRVAKTPRNAPCPCQSGRKFKRCCGR